MTAHMQQLFQGDMQLSAEERVELAEELIASSADAPPFDPSWYAEISRRSAEIDQGTAAMGPADELLKHTIQEVRSRRSV